MALNVQILFGRPQQEIASLLTDRLARCASASLVAGFLTPEGLEAIAGPIRSAPHKISNIVVGAATYRAFEGLDGLLAAGVASNQLHVHLGHSRPTGASARHRFYRYHPMLHSKVYLLQMADGSAAAFVGSHNLTGFALLGLNGEAGVLLEGDAMEAPFVELRQHIADSVAQAVPYDPSQKEAYVWWASEFLEGLRAKTNDMTRDAEGQRTIVVIAEQTDPSLPSDGDIVYFELPEALGTIQSLQADVHIYLFRSLPPSPAHALAQLGNAAASLWCRVRGLEMEQGGVELRAQWYIDDRRRPSLRRTPRQFRPRVAPGMQQVRVVVHQKVYDKFEYLFDSGKKQWLPVFEQGKELLLHDSDRNKLVPLDLVPREDLPWQRVRALEPAEPRGQGAYQLALAQSAPESGSFVLFSLRRRRQNA